MEMKTGVYHIKKYKDWIEFVKKLFPDSGDYIGLKIKKIGIMRLIILILIIAITVEKNG